MEWGAKRLLALALVLIGRCVASAQFDIFDDYLDLPNLNELAQLDHREILEALLKLQVTRVSNSDWILDEIERWRSSSDKHFAIYELLGDFLIMQQPYERIGRLLMTVKSIIAQTRADQEGKLANYSNFLTVGFGPKFMTTASFIEENYFDFEVKQIISTFDNVFFEVLEMDDKQSVLPDFDRLLNQLKGLDLKTEEIVARDKIGAHLLHQCDSVLQYQLMLDVFNIAAVLSSWTSKFGATERLNEYHRLCLSFMQTGRS